MIYFMVGQISKSKDGDIKLSTVRLKSYSSLPTISTVTTDYKLGIRYNGKNPIIVGRAYLANDSQKILLERILSSPNVTYDMLKSYATIFTDGFVVDSNAKTEEELRKIIAPEMKINGAKVLWKVSF